MIRNFFISALRNLKRSKYLTLVNIAGMVVSLTCGLLVAQYLSYELSYDSFHEDGERIFRVYREGHFKGDVSRMPGLISSAVPELMREQEGIEASVRYLARRDFFEVPELSLEADYAYTDSSFFQVFNFPLLIGKASELNEKKKVAFLSTGFAHKLFNDAQPLGKRFKYKGHEFEVVGVFDNLPSNSHLQAEVILPFGILPASYHNFPDFQDTDCYLKLKEVTQKPLIEASINRLLDQHQYGIKSEKRDNGAIFMLQPLSDVHLYSADFKGVEGENPGSIEVFTLLGVFAFLIMAMSWFNYINLSLANALQRGKEVGMRRVIGARKWHIYTHFFVETGLLLVTSFVLAFTLYQFLTPRLEGLFNIRSVSFFNDTSLIRYWPFQAFFGLVLLSAFFTSIYIGSITTSFKAISALKGGLSGITKGISFKKGLMTIQFVIAIFAITASGLIQRQMDYVLNRDYGANTENVIAFKYDRAIRKKISPEVFANKLAAYPFVESYSLSSSVPGVKGAAGRGGIGIVSFKDEEGKTVVADPVLTMEMDEKFLEFYDVNLLAGTNFISGSTNEDLVLVNEKYSRSKGYETPEEAIGQKYGKKKIIGVFEDFHQHSMNKETMAVVANYRGKYPHTMYSARIKPGMMATAYATLSDDWHAVFETQRNPPIILDEHIQKQYNSDKTFVSSIHVLTLITLFISITGLIGITHLSVVHRLKEIGLRKIMGARWSSVIALFGRSYVMLISLAMIMAIPLSLAFFDQWVQRFIYQAAFSYLPIVLTAGCVLIISSLILIYQASRSFRVRPVDSLRYE